MENNIVNIGDTKEKRKCARVIYDIDKITQVLMLTQQSLQFFKHYIPVQEIISIIETNKVLFDLHKKKYKEELDKMNEK